jgi:hypothetical protein
MSLDCIILLFTLSNVSRVAIGLASIIVGEGGARG